MATSEAKVTIDREPAVVWGIVGDFPAIDKFFPGIEAVVIEGDDRVMTMAGGQGTVRERLVARDEDAMSYTYAAIEGVPFTSHQATVTVTPSDGGSTVTWVVDVEPGEAAPAVAGAYQSVLEGLRDSLS